MKKFLLTIGLFVVLFILGYFLAGKNLMLAGLIAALGTVILK